jgi:DNA-binding NtrC family response regulator
MTGAQRFHLQRVLVCDDDPGCRLSLVDVLRAYGYETCEAGHAVEALFVARKMKIDFGFFDYELPDADGATAVERIREERIKFPWALMSGAETIAESRVAAAGAVAFLHKPLDIKEVRRILRDCLGFAL